VARHLYLLFFLLLSWVVPAASQPVPLRWRADDSTLRDDPHNLKYEDNTPRITADGRLIFFNSSRYAGRPWAHLMPGGTRYDFDVYYARRDTLTGEWGPVVNLGKSINTDNDDGIDAISLNGGTIYYTSLQRTWVTDGGPFYSADLDSSGIHNIHGLGGGITSFFKSADTFRIYGASISPGGDDFYFATTAHTLNGDQRIWVSHLRDDLWSFPENLGRRINTKGGSYAPFIASDGETLYFTSGRPGGSGGDDIYRSVLTENGWSEPVSLGPLVNTDGHDRFFSLPAFGDPVFIIQRGDTSRVVTIPMPKEHRPAGVVLITGKVIDKVTKLPVNAELTVQDRSTGGIVRRTTGNGIDKRYAVILSPGHEYGITAAAAGYALYSSTYKTERRAAMEEVELDIRLEPAAEGVEVTLNNISFGYDADTLRPESFTELNRVVELMHANPGLEIRVEGHSDSRGPEDYNLTLSGRRAEAVRSYLIERGGIAPERITSLGLGSSQPTASNRTDDGRRQNRRVGFRIIKVGGSNVNSSSH
jgi:outer membrane protein OmpA-like peptidoglycan-associated protein